MIYISYILKARPLEPPAVDLPLDPTRGRKAGSVPEPLYDMNTHEH